MNLRRYIFSTFHHFNFSTCVCAAALCAAQTSHAAHIEETVTLTNGWNAIYLESTPEEAGCEAFFAGAPVKSVASYYSDAYSYTRQLAADGSEIAQKPISYYVWIAGDEVASTMTELVGGRAYMIYATNTWSKTFYGVPAVPRQTWRAADKDGGFMNLVGVSADTNAVMLAKAYFGEGPYGTASGIAYKICGVKSSAPTFLPMTFGSTKVRGGMAYALTSTKDADWPGVIGVQGRGVNFSAGSNYASIQVRNCGTADRTFSFTMVPSADSEATGELVPPIARRLPRTDAISAGSFSNVEESVAWKMDFAADETKELVFSLDRSRIEQGKQYGAILVIEDEGASKMRVRLPITVSSSATDSVAYPTGLWYGAIELSLVSGIDDETPVPSGGKLKMNVMMHVDENKQCTLLQRVALGVDTNGTPRLFRELSSVPTDEVPDPRRLSVVMMSVDTPVVAGAEGTEFGDTAVFGWTVAPRARDNPFRHAWHPDHDGKKADYSDYLPFGDDPSLYANTLKPELWSIVNGLKFTWHEGGNDANPVNFQYDPSETTSGIVFWDVDGLISTNRPIRTVGTFALKRVFKASTVE